MRTKILAAMLGLLCALGANAYDFKEGGLCYNINADGASVTVTYQHCCDPQELEPGEEAPAKAYDDDERVLTIPETVAHNGSTYTVTAIGRYAFYGCSGFTAFQEPIEYESDGYFIIPNTVTEIGASAFRGCTHLGAERLIIGNSVETIGAGAFRGSSFGGLTLGNSVKIIDGNNDDGGAFEDCGNFFCNLVLPNTLCEIGERAFRRSGYFTGTLRIPESVTTISRRAFEYCIHDGLLILPSSLEIIESRAFHGCSFSGSLTIPDGVWAIEGEAFADCPYFDGSLTIGNMVRYIGFQAFRNCSGFTGSLTIPNSVLDIDAGAFNGCSGFNGTLTIGNSVESIGGEGDGSNWDDGYGAFAGCTGFTGPLVIPESVTYIGKEAFKNCYGFESLTVADGNPKYDSRDNCNAIIETATNTMIGGINHFTIPETVTAIGWRAFRGCSGFTGSLTIPNSVTHIYGGAFDGCTGFTGPLTIGKSVISIGGEPEYHDTPDAVRRRALASDWPDDEGPSSVTTTGIYAFYNCRNISSVVSLIEDVSATECVEDAFNCYPKVTRPLYVPCGTLAAYQTTAPWSSFTTIVEQCDVEPGDLNGDSTLDIDDLNIVVNMVLGVDTVSDAADLNGDGIVDVTDVNELINAILNAND
ncbi:MAG: leucine-rich repeat protein [Muribaculaceae bacterium]|nr:leucine-rich repeat protein [Muribaculaceae bacterium]